jgi:hypothetical protein
VLDIIKSCNFKSKDALSGVVEDQSKAVEPEGDAFTYEGSYKFSCENSYRNSYENRMSRT